MKLESLIRITGGKIQTNMSHSVARTNKLTWQVLNGRILNMGKKEKRIRIRIIIENLESE